MASAEAETKLSFDTVASKLASLAEEIPGILPMHMRMVGEEIMADVKNSGPGHGVPRDTGNLADSGLVFGGNEVSASVELSFGGPEAPYAVVQHERMDYYHPVGEPRYLVRGIERWDPAKSPAMKSLRKSVLSAIQKRNSSGRFSK